MKTQMSICSLMLLLSPAAELHADGCVCNATRLCLPADNTRCITHTTTHTHTHARPFSHITCRACTLAAPLLFICCTDVAVMLCSDLGRRTSDGVPQLQHVQAPVTVRYNMRDSHVIPHFYRGLHMFQLG